MRTDTLLFCLVFFVSGCCWRSRIMTKVVEFRPSAPVQILLVSFCAGDMEGGTRSHVQSGRINSPGGPSKSCCCCTYVERNQVSKCFLSDKVFLIPLLLCLLSLGLCIIFLKWVLAHGSLRSKPSDLMDLKGGKQYPTEAYLQTTALPEQFGKGAVDVLTPGALSTSSSASPTPSVTFLTSEHTDKQVRTHLSLATQIQAQPTSQTENIHTAEEFCKCIPAFLVYCVV